MVVRTGLEPSFSSSRKIENPRTKAKSASDSFAFRRAFPVFVFKMGFGMGYLFSCFFLSRWDNALKLLHFAEYPCILSMDRIDCRPLKYEVEGPAKASPL